MADGTRALAGIPNAVDGGHSAPALDGCGPGLGMPFTGFFCRLASATAAWYLFCSEAQACSAAYCCWQVLTAARTLATILWASLRLLAAIVAFTVC